MGSVKPTKLTPEMWEAHFADQKKRVGIIIAIMLARLPNSGKVDDHAYHKQRYKPKDKTHNNRSASKTRDYLGSYLQSRAD